MESKEFKNKKIMVFGWARSGKAATQRLVELRATVVVVNNSTFNKADEVYQKLVNDGVIFIENDSDNVLDSTFDYVIKNPGIKYETPIIQKAISLDIPILTEVEIALSSFEGKVVAVTGSNGKTTTTSLIRDMLLADNQSVVTAGNIGTPVCEVMTSLKETDILLLELSSFQLMGTPDIQPDIALITNIFSNHLDYHGNRENYVNAKFQITKNQTSNQILVLNAEGKDTAKFESDTHAKVIKFSSGNRENIVRISGDSLIIDNEPLMPLTEIKLVGPHNLQNILAAVTVAKQLQVSNLSIKKVLKEFGGVKHRLEYVGTYNQIKYYNDSKATDIEATQTALESFQQPTIWLAGGLDRGDDLMRLLPDLLHVKLVIAFGETQQKVVELARAASKPVITVTSVKEAVPVANKCAESGDVVLLSPAAASWDQYENFEIRGEEFVKELKQTLGV
ncbi:UDP-N-acetylmuramoyl-L-alanine--D-glutamate ligase [Leuconostoc palmae]|uniref:UDP-N-acetylmuramoyl-L-alanine--D-glutamate ligase n=1 Tax=Leuconostoc palmae TaxID=501487 RepID=UPI001C7E00A4|nr:UDP-N-acetylmuramoyl-L-alanine--D-glutamate ligase [Leuconostoc palmae]